MNYLYLIQLIITDSLLVEIILHVENSVAWTANLK